MRGSRWAALAAGAMVVGGVAAAAWARRGLVVLTVDGMSMSPALYPGQRVLVRRGTRGVAPGRIAVLSRPDPETGWAFPPTGDLDAGGWCIKRIAAVAGQPYPARLGRQGDVPDGHVVVLGDHPDSDDSTRHGPCPVDRILGVQVRRLPTPDLAPVEAAASSPVG